MAVNSRILKVTITDMEEGKTTKLFPSPSGTHWDMSVTTKPGTVWYYTIPLSQAVALIYTAGLRGSEIEVYPEGEVEYGL